MKMPAYCCSCELQLSPQLLEFLSRSRFRHIADKGASSSEISNTITNSYSRNQHSLHDYATFTRENNSRRTSMRSKELSERTGAATLESLKRHRPIWLTSPAFHVCGSVSPFHARYHHRNQNRKKKHPWKVGNGQARTQCCSNWPSPCCLLAHVPLQLEVVVFPIEATHCL